MRLKIFEIPEKQRLKYNQWLHHENYQRFKILPLVVIFFCALYLLQYLIFPGKENNSIYFSYYLALFLSMPLVSILFRGILPILHKKISLSSLENIFIIYSSLIFIFCICLTILDLTISNDYSAYAIGVIGLPFVMRISFQRYLLVVINGFLIFLVGTIFFIDKPLDMTLILPIFVFTLFSGYISFSLGETRKKLYILKYELEEKNKILKEAAFRDPLTNLYNRRFMLQFLLKQIAFYKRYQVPVSLQILDIDYFKKINDKLGHSIGDQVILEIADILRDYSRKSDLIARYGGEEFIIISPGIGKEDAYLLGERVRHKIENHNFSNIPWEITTSIGISEILKTDTENTLINRADKYLYNAKTAGRNCCRIS